MRRHFAAQVRQTHRFRIALARAPFLNLRTRSCTARTAHFFGYIVHIRAYVQYWANLRNDLNLCAIQFWKSELLNFWAPITVQRFRIWSLSYGTLNLCVHWVPPSHVTNKGSNCFPFNKCCHVIDCRYLGLKFGRQSNFWLDESSQNLPTFLFTYSGCNLVFDLQCNLNLHKLFTWRSAHFV